MYMYICVYLTKSSSSIYLSIYLHFYLPFFLSSLLFLIFYILTRKKTSFSLYISPFPPNSPSPRRRRPFICHTHTTALQIPTPTPPPPSLTHSKMQGPIYLPTYLPYRSYAILYHAMLLTRYDICGCMKDSVVVAGRRGGGGVCPTPLMSVAFSDRSVTTRPPSLHHHYHHYHWTDRQGNN